MYNESAAADYDDDDDDDDDADSVDDDGADDDGGNDDYVGVNIDVFSQWLAPGRSRRAPCHSENAPKRAHLGPKATSVRGLAPPPPLAGAPAASACLLGHQAVRSGPSRHCVTLTLHVVKLADDLRHLGVVGGFEGHALQDLDQFLALADQLRAVGDESLVVLAARRVGLCSSGEETAESISRARWSWCVWCRKWRIDVV